MCPVLYTHSQKEQAPKEGSPMSIEDNKAFIRSYFDAIGGTDEELGEAIAEFLACSLPLQPEGSYVHA